LSISEDKYRRLRQELIGGIFALIVVFLLGTLWYHLVGVG
jgi:voltage-gated potassium channel